MSSRIRQVMCHACRVMVDTHNGESASRVKRRPHEQTRRSFSKPCQPESDLDADEAAVRT